MSTPHPTADSLASTPATSILNPALFHHCRKTEAYALSFDHGAWRSCYLLPTIWRLHPTGRHRDSHVTLVVTPQLHLPLQLAKMSFSSIPDTKPLLKDTLYSPISYFRPLSHLLEPSFPFHRNVLHADFGKSGPIREPPHPSTIHFNALDLFSHPALGRFQCAGCAPPTHPPPILILGLLVDHLPSALRTSFFHNHADSPIPSATTPVEFIFLLCRPGLLLTPFSHTLPSNSHPFFLAALISDYKTARRPDPFPLQANTFVTGAVFSLTPLFVLFCVIVAPISLVSTFSCSQSFLGVVIRISF